jgi:hypothetical protein
MTRSFHSSLRRVILLRNILSLYFPAVSHAGIRDHESIRMSRPAYDILAHVYVLSPTFTVSQFFHTIHTCIFFVVFPSILRAQIRRSANPGLASESVIVSVIGYDNLILISGPPRDTDGVIVSRAIALAIDDLGAGGTTTVPVSTYWTLSS